MISAEIDREGASSFLILGAAKCATSSLYEYMDQHPDLCMSRPKEPIFFEAEVEKGLSFYREKYFGHWQGQPVVGEARAHNLALPFVPSRIHRLLPEARLIAVLRNPVDRLYSEWWHRYSRGLDGEGLSQAIETNLRRIESGQTFEGEAGASEWSRVLRDRRSTAIRFTLYLELGHYAQQIRRYLALFPKEQLKLVLFEDLERSDQVVRDLWQFVGVDADQDLDTGHRHNKALEVQRGPLAAGLLRLPVRGLARQVLPASVRGLLRKRVTGRPAVQPPMDPEVERRLLDYYEPHNRALEELLGRELPGWFAADARRTTAIQPERAGGQR